MASLIQRFSCSRLFYRIDKFAPACQLNQNSITSHTCGTVSRTRLLSCDVINRRNDVKHLRINVVPVKSYHVSANRRFQGEKQEEKAYYQTENEESEGREMSEEEIRLCILSSALDFVGEHGWTTEAISAGAVSEGLPGVAHGMFPRGGVELVEYFYKDCNGRLADRLAEEAERIKADGGKIQVTKFVRDAVEHRLRMIHPYIDKWSEAMGLQALPQNARTSWQNLLDLSDDIWYYAGDTSTDVDWYTKRLSLAYVYKTTEVYMLQDQSDDFQDTWQFLDNRLNDVKTLGKSLSQGKSLLGTAADLLKAASSVGLNVTGLNRHDRRSR